MDESDEYEPILPDEQEAPRKPITAAPLPRLWKTPPDTEEIEAAEQAKSKKAKLEEEPPPKKKPRKPQPLFKAKKKPEPEIDDGTGATKLEETPVLDTYEARQRARWIVTGLGVAIALIFGTIIYNSVAGGPKEEIREGEMPDPRTVSETKPDTESGARIMLDNAKQADKLGKTQAALTLLSRLVKTYPNTNASRDGQAALDRNRDGKPLFGDSLAQASGPKPIVNSASTVATGPTSTPTPSAPTSAVPTNATKPEPPKSAPTVADNPAAASPAVPPPVAIRPLPNGYRPDFNAPIHLSGWPTRIISDRDGVELVLIPAGAFDMGRGDGEPQEGPVHPVTLSTYYIDKHEVTVRQYSRFLKATGRPLDVVRKGIPKGVTPEAYEDYPIVNISSGEAAEFCKWAHRSLPTEAQWEMAARSADGRISFWNGELPRKDPEKGPRQMEPVMSLSTDISPFGVFDMGANAWEWTADYYDSQYYKQFRDLVTDPPGPTKKSRTGLITMSVRGGSKQGFLTWREGLKVETRAPYLGFRGALPVEAVAQPANGTNKPAVPTNPIRGTNSGPI